MIWDVIIQNINYSSKMGGLDMCGDETSCYHQVWGDANSGPTFNIINKYGVTKGGKIVLVTDVDRLFPRAHVHQNKVHTQPTNFKYQGPNKLHMMILKKRRIWW